jgi:4'-phosphopantetheinyl transferase
MLMVNVDIQLLNVVQWNSAAECTFQLNDEVDVWRIHIPSYQSSVTRLVNLLQPDEIARANRYLQQKDRTRFIVSRGILRQIIGSYTHEAPTAVVFKTGPNKKPYVNGARLKYNVSHTADWVLIAIANADIGVDTETIDPSFGYAAILPDNFSPVEIDFIDQSAENFFLLWTRKEALTKATGQGLDDNLKYIPCLDGSQLINNEVLLTNKNWLVRSFKLDDGNWGSVVSEVNSGVIRFFDYSLNINP